MSEVVIPGPTEFRTPIAVIVILTPDPVLVHESRSDAAGRSGVFLLHPSVAEFQEPLVRDARDQRRTVGRSCKGKKKKPSVKL